MWKKRAHVIGNTQDQSLAIGESAYFDGRSVRSATSNVPVQTETAERPERLSVRLRREVAANGREPARRSCRLGKALLLKGDPPARAGPFSCAPARARDPRICQHLPSG